MTNKGICICRIGMAQFQISSFNLLNNSLRSRITLVIHNERSQIKVTFIALAGLIATPFQWSANALSPRRSSCVTPARSRDSPAVGRGHIHPTEGRNNRAIEEYEVPGKLMPTKRQEKYTAAACSFPFCDAFSPHF